MGLEFDEQGKKVVQVKGVCGYGCAEGILAEAAGEYEAGEQWLSSVYGLSVCLSVFV